MKGQLGAGAHNVDGEGLAAGVPEGVDEDLIVLDRNRAHRRAEVKRTPLEHHLVACATDSEASASKRRACAMSITCRAH
jgi:hypothetical protein